MAASGCRRHHIHDVGRLRLARKLVVSPALAVEQGADAHVAPSGEPARADNCM